MTEICPREYCAGCCACMNVCPKSSIEMMEDKVGCIYPEVCQETCIDCGLCQKVCPVVTPLPLNQTEKGFIAYAKDLHEQQTAASGGIASVLSDLFIERSGVVYGSSATQSFNVKHVRVAERENLEQLKGSKYVHSYIGLLLKDLLSDLKNERDVLFIGTPCQVAGVRGFLRKDYPNFYALDLVCHGVPPQKVLASAIGNACGEDAQKVKSIRFRRKDENGKISYGLYLDGNDGTELYARNIPKDSYSLGFMKALFYRPNCYSCPYARPERIGDLTLGDFWEKDKPANLPQQRQYGISMVLCNTPKGERLLELCKERLIMKEHPKDDLLMRNTLLRKPMPKHREYDAFQRTFSNDGYAACKPIFRRMRAEAYKQMFMIKLSKVIYKLPFTEKIYSRFFRKKI